MNLIIGILLIWLGFGLLTSVLSVLYEGCITYSDVLAYIVVTVLGPIALVFFLYHILTFDVNWNKIIWERKPKR